MRLTNNLQQFMMKEALDVVKGGPISRWSASTLGRANPLSLFNLLLTSKAYSSPHTGDRFAKHKTTAETIEAGSEEALSDTLLRLGGTDLIDDILWKKEHGGGSLPWYKQLGGRSLHNRRTGPLGKLLGYPTSIIGSLVSPLMRAPHYNPYTDVATQFMDEPAVTQHELGHAIDMNTLTGSRGKDEGAISKSMLGRLGSGALRDLYMLAYGLGPVALWHEAQANIESRKALIQAYEESDRDPEKLYKILQRRAEVLPAGYGSYIGATIPGLNMVPAAPLITMLAGKAYGKEVADQPDYIKGKMGPIMKKRLEDLRKKKDKKKKAAGVKQAEVDRRSDSVHTTSREDMAPLDQYGGYMPLRKIPGPESRRLREDLTQEDFAGVKDLMNEWLTQHTPYTPEKFWEEPEVSEGFSDGAIHPPYNRRSLRRNKSDITPEDLEKWIQGATGGPRAENTFKNNPYDPEKPYMPHLISQAISRGDPRANYFKKDFELGDSNPYAYQVEDPANYPDSRYMRYLASSLPKARVEAPPVVSPAALPAAPPNNQAAAHAKSKKELVEAQRKAREEMQRKQRVQGRLPKA